MGSRSLCNVDAKMSAHRFAAEPRDMGTVVRHPAARPLDRSTLTVLFLGVFACAPTPKAPTPFSVDPLSGLDARMMHRRSHHPGCPVPIASLRKLSVRYWGFDEKEHDGVLVVHESVAGPLLEIFRTLLKARFPIRRMVPVDHYDGDDARSMQDDNTSAYNCREVTGRPGIFSEHAYGTAVDINPRENPYVRGDLVLPPEGAAFLDRESPRPGMIRAGDIVHRAFLSAGFGWGGSFVKLRDYQHFSTTGR